MEAGVRVVSLGSTPDPDPCSTSLIPGNHTQGSGREMNLRLKAHNRVEHVFLAQ